jgi:hypothetical protein
MKEVWKAQRKMGERRVAVLSEQLHVNRYCIAFVFYKALVSLVHKSTLQIGGVKQVATLQRRKGGVPARRCWCQVRAKSERTE